MDLVVIVSFCVLLYCLLGLGAVHCDCFVIGGGGFERCDLGLIDWFVLAWVGGLLAFGLAYFGHLFA